MSNKHKKIFIFNKYSENLKFLKQNGFLRNINLMHENTYICPICLRQFSENDLNDKVDNPLTLEHAPPESAGGRGIVLTCDECNNMAGTKYDDNLKHWLQENDSKNWNLNSIRKGRVLVEGLSKPLNAKVKYTANPGGIARVDLDIKGNHPDLINEFKNRPKSNMEYTFPSKIDIYKAEKALLKSAYLLMFAKFGYSFLFDKVYDEIRAQLLSLDKPILSTGLHFDAIDEKLPDNVYLSRYPLGEGFICITTLKIQAESPYRYATHLPIPYTNAEQTIVAFANSGTMSVEVPWGEWNFLSNKEDILEVHDWFMQVGISHVRLKGYRGIKLIY